MATGGPARVGRDRLLELAADVCRNGDATGALPALARATGGIAVPVASLYRSLLDLTVDGAAGVRALRSPPESVPLVEAAELPEVGDEISEHFARRVRRWMHRPGLDVDELIRLTRAQTWTLRATAAA